MFACDSAHCGPAMNPRIEIERTIVRALIATAAVVLILALSIPTPTFAGEAAQQVETFFGVSGVLSLFGGARGRTFLVSGVLYDVDLPSLNADETLFLPGLSGSYADGVARVLFDTRGRTWQNVVYLGQFEADPLGPQPGVWGSDSGWILPYRAVFHGLS